MKTLLMVMGHVACERVQSVCQSIISTVDELLTGDPGERDDNNSENESADVHN